MDLIWILIVGGLIGWLSGNLIGRVVPGGVIGNIVAGFIGSWLGAELLGSRGPIRVHKQKQKTFLAAAKRRRRFTYQERIMRQYFS